MSVVPYVHPVPTELLDNAGVRDVYLTNWEDIAPWRKCYAAALGRVNEPQSALLQLRVLGFGLLVNGDVRVGVFPKGEEVFVGGEGADAGGVAIGRGGLG